jgi:hypothetical protein
VPSKQAIALLGSPARCGVGITGLAQGKLGLFRKNHPSIMVRPIELRFVAMGPRR